MYVQFLLFSLVYFVSNLKKWPKKVIRFSNLEYVTSDVIFDFIKIEIKFTHYLQLFLLSNAK